MEKYRRRKQWRISSWNLLNRSLLEDFAQNAQKNNKNRFPLLEFLTTFSIRISSTICKNGRTRGNNPPLDSTDSGARSTLVNETTPPPHLTNPGYCPKRPFTRMHAGHSVLPSVSQSLTPSNYILYLIYYLLSVIYYLLSIIYTILYIIYY